VTRFGGILPAAVTPVDADGRFRSDVVTRLLSRLYATGADGIYVCGTTGEGMLQSTSQRRDIAAAAVDNSPAGKQVIVHVGAPSTREAVELARHAGTIGAAAVSSLPPAGGFSFREIRQYYAEVAGSAGVPLFLYYFPASGGPALELDQLLELCALPGVAGIKITDFDLYRLRELKREGAIVFCGRDEVLVAGLLMGADGGIGTFYNLLPQAVVRLYALARVGEWEAALAEQDRVNALVRAVAPFSLFPAVKQILEWSGLDCGPCLPPRGRLRDDERALLRRRLDEAGLGGLLALEDQP
jgi:N-acetylneuraminate lyase